MEKQGGPATDPRRELNAIVDDLQAYIRYCKDEGRDSIEIIHSPAREGAPEPSAAATAAPADVAAALADVAARVARCTLCELCKTRTRAVPGQGAASPDIMFIGEGPGADEDIQGLAFVGRAGQLLTKIIEAMGYTRDQVFIGNIVKCRPPGNRTPMPEEMQACMPYLTEQIALLRPKVIVALGATAVRGLLEVETGITKLRGKWMTYQNTPLMPTYHPAYLLRNPAGKRDVWEDMKAVLAHLGRTPPARK